MLSTHSPGGALTIQGVAHIESCVGNSYQYAQFFHSAPGFSLVGYQGPETGTPDSIPSAPQQGDIRRIVSGGLSKQLGQSDWQHRRPGGA